MPAGLTDSDSISFRARRAVTRAGKAQLAALVRLNPMRVDLVERFERLVADCNAGRMNVEAFFQELLTFKKTPSEEEEKTQVRQVADELLSTLKHGKLVVDRRKEQATRAAVRVAVEETLDRLPEMYTRQIYAQKCNAVHVFDSYWDDGQSVYAMAA